MIARGTLGFLPARWRFLGIFFSDLLVFLAGRSLDRAVWAGAAQLVQARRRSRSSQWVEQGRNDWYSPTLLRARLPTTSRRGCGPASPVRCTSSWLRPVDAGPVGLSAVFGEAVSRSDRVQRKAFRIPGHFAGPFLALKLAFAPHSPRTALLLSRWRRLTRGSSGPGGVLSPVCSTSSGWRSSARVYALLRGNPAIPAAGSWANRRRDPAGTQRGRRSGYRGTAARRRRRASKVENFRPAGAGWPVVLKPDVGERRSGLP
jgi:hypothetical protein